MFINQYYTDLVLDAGKAAGGEVADKLLFLLQSLNDKGELAKDESPGLWNTFCFLDTEEGITYWCMVAHRLDRYRQIERAKKAVKEALYE